MIPGVSSLDNLCADLGVDPGSLGLQVVKADRFLLGRTRLCANEHVVIVQPGVVGYRQYSFASASPALYRIMETIANDVVELATFEKDPKAYLLRHSTLTQDEEREFR